jgi:hypothetical protein
MTSPALRKTKPTSQQNPRLVIATALISAMTTIAVSFIAIVPQLRNDDRKEIEDLRLSYEKLSKQLKSDSERWTISGRIRPTTSKYKMRDRMEVSVVPTSFTAITDNEGRYLLRDISPGAYFLLLRYRTGNPITLNIPSEKTQDDKEVDGFKVEYNIK